MQITFIRHAETEANVKKIHSGWYETPLTKKGIEETKEIKRFQDYKLVFSSDLSRAYKTAQYLTKIETPIVLEGLREFHYGDLEGQDEDKKRTIVVHKKIYNNESIYGTETIIEAYQRLFFSINEIIDIMDSQKESKSLVVAHHGILVLLKAYLEQIPVDQLHKVKIDNLGTITLCFEFPVKGNKLKILKSEQGCV